MAQTVSQAERRDGDNVEMVHDQLRRSILRGELEAGVTFSQVQLAARCGVSRTPLREALRMLQREGLITSEPNRRVTVAPFSLPDLEQIYSMRVLLEAAAIRASVPVMTPEDIADLQGHLARMDHFAAESDYDRWDVPHRAFHQGLVRRAGDRFASTLAELSDHGERYRRYYTVNEPKFGARGAKEHKAILEAVKQRDLDASAAALVLHLSHTVYALIDMVDPGYEPRLFTGILTDLLGSDAVPRSARKRRASPKKTRRAS
jgi:GntR family transcriptional regulator, rspAB operon transcriptional repressor